ncbi:MAG: hypothetical protein AABW81_02920 [Nanoarchaeota archaeon]
MKLVGFNFNKINVERYSDRLEDIKINTNVDIIDIKNISNDILKTKEELLITKFTFKVDYSPNFAQIELSGTIIFSLDPKDAKQVLKEWESKKINEKFKMDLFSVILRKSNIKSLELEEELNLPLHIPLFSLKKKEDK